MSPLRVWLSFTSPNGYHKQKNSAVFINSPILWYRKISQFLMMFCKQIQYVTIIVTWIWSLRMQNSYYKRSWMAYSVTSSYLKVLNGAKNMQLFSCEEEVDYNWMFVVTFFHSNTTLVTSEYRNGYIYFLQIYYLEWKSVVVLFFNIGMLCLSALHHNHLKTQEKPGNRWTKMDGFHSAAANESKAVSLR